MTSFRKKLLLIFFALFASAGIGLSILFLPEKPSAAPTTIDDPKYFKIDNGVFNGLTDEAVKYYGRNNFAVRLPATVTEIGIGNAKPVDGAGSTPSANLLFGDLTGYLTGVTFEAPENLTKIGYRAFVSCSKLTSIDLGGASALTELEGGAFRECTSLASAVLPEGVTVLPEYLFRGCTALKTVELKGAVTSIGMSTFLNCGALDFALPQTLESIGDSAFSGCASFKSVEVPATVESLGNSVFSGCIRVEEASLPSGIEEIPAGTFQNCTALKQFDIPATVKKIGDKAFSNCYSFTEITVPAGITDIGLNAFFGLDGIRRINYNAVQAKNVAAAPFAMTNDAYNRSEGVEVHIGNPEKNAVSFLPSRLFDGHRAISKVYFENVNILSGARDFGNSMFRNCEALEEVEFAGGCVIPFINVETFKGCVRLQTVEGIENISLNTIGKDSFYGCRALYTVTVGSGVTAINEGAFLGCTRLIEVKNLSSLTINAGEANKNGEVARYAKHVYGADGTPKIDPSPYGLGYIFYADITDTASDIWLIEYVGDATNLTLPSSYSQGGVQYKYNIYECAFMGNTDITHVTIPDSAYPVEKIRDSAFAGCTSLISVDLPKDLLETGENVFQGCTSLTEVDFNANNKLSTISDYMFGGCKALAEIEIPAKVQIIRTYAFSGCSNLKSVTFKGNAVTNINGHSFEDCGALEAIEIPSGVKKIEVSAFANCSSLKFVYLPSDAEYKEGVFGGCHEDLILISENKDGYASDKMKPGLAGFVTDGKLTYLVDLKLIYNDGCAGDDTDNEGVHTVKRLFNMPGGLRQNAGSLIWEDKGMPVQDGHDGTQKYAESKWFGEKTYGTEIDVAELTEMLKAEGVSEIRLYARYFAKPEIEALNSVPYEAGKTYTVKEILTSLFGLDGNAMGDAEAENIINTFSVSVTAHLFINGEPDASWVWEAGKTVADAGTYTLSISLPEDGSYGIWADTLTVDFTITAGEVDITDALIWRGLAPSVDETRTLYFYNGTTTPNLEELDNQTSVETAVKSNSYTVYTGSEITISLDWSDALHTYGEIGSYTGVTASAAGTYKATAVITPSNNFILTYGTDTETLERLRVTYGVTFDKREDGTVLVSKTWYIAISDLNQLLSGDENVGGLFHIPTEWTYGDASQIPVKPTMSKIPDQASEKLRFTFTYTDCKGNVIRFNDGNRISVDEYDRYFNESMPAGKYEATFYIEDGVDENGKPVAGDPSGTTFVFTVNEVAVDSSSVSGITGMITGGDVSYEGSEPRFRGADAVELLNLIYSQKTPGSNRVWAGYPDYFTPFEIKYCVVSGNEAPDGNYYTEAEYNAGAGAVKPEAIGAYTVYYIMQAPNYSTIISGSYKLNITYTVIPVLSGFDYDGENVLNAVLSSLKKQLGYDYYDIYTMLDYSKLPESDSLNRETRRAPESLIIDYMASWGKNDDYSKIGTHYLFLKIKEEYVSYIRWNGTASTDYFVLRVEIVASANSLVVNEWQFGRFDEAVNVPVLKVSYGADTRYCFKLVGEKGTQYLYYTDEEMNKHVPAENTFRAAPVGTYTLVASAYLFENGNNKTMFETETTLKVHKVAIDFAKTPYISGWTYGQLTIDTDTSAIIKNLLMLGAGIDAGVKDEIVIKYIEVSRYEQGVKPTALRLSTDANGFVPCGDYYAVLTRVADGNYEELCYEIIFSVLPTANHWVETPADSTLANISIRKDAENSVYKLFRSYYGTADDMKIEIREQGSGEWRNVADGSFPYASVTGMLNEGSYEMRITVTGANVGELQETVKLVIVNAADLPSGDGNVPPADGGVSDTAVTVAIIVFAVMAVAVLVTGTVIYVINKKKADAEYLKTVKSEMKRR